MVCLRSFVTCGLMTLATATPEYQTLDRKSFFKEIDSSTWVFGNDKWNVTQGRQYATKLMYGGKNLVGRAVGHYVSYNGAQSDLNWTSAAIIDSGDDWINIQFKAKEGDFYWLIQDGLVGAYQYFVNHALPTLGEFRTLWRLDNISFPNGKNNWRDGKLPALEEYLAAENVQDETWRKADGTYLTKYDWAAFTREQDVYGVYGPQSGSWYIHASHDYLNGDHLKQELMIHRESKTGDAVHLNMLHGTHFQAASTDVFADGKTWGPWLWLLNNGSFDDAKQRASQEREAWPYKWFNDTSYQSRGSITGKLALSDGRPAAGAAVFLGDNSSKLSTLDQGKGYYYTTYADQDGVFEIKDIRTGTYTLSAWPASGANADVSTTFVQNDIKISKGVSTDLKTLTWKISDPKFRIFQVGAFDRQTTGFNGSDPPYKHGRISSCPNLTFTAGKSKDAEWCFGQSSVGTHSIVFTIPSLPTSAVNAKLSLSLAGYSSGSTADVLVNGVKVGGIPQGNMATSQDTYRGATRAGEWRLLEYSLNNDSLKQGENKIEFKVTKSTQWRGWLWDSIFLEWV